MQAAADKRRGRHTGNRAEAADRGRVAVGCRGNDRSGGHGPDATVNRPAGEDVILIMSAVHRLQPGSRPQPGGRSLLGLRVAGAGLLAATAAIHLDLYLTGYRTIPTIGTLFLLQVIAGFVLAAAALVTGRWLVTGAGAGFCVATLAGYLLSIWVGLFGFREVSTTAGIVAGLIEVAGFAVLAVAAIQDLRRLGVLARLPVRLRSGGATVTAVGAAAAVALVLLGAALAGAGSPAAPATASTGSGQRVVKADRIGGVSLLTNAQGFTLYVFAPDPLNKSVCNGGCAAYWPPVPGPVTAGPGVTGHLGTITRADGARQATYNGHPLYTYIADSAPGQVHGNNINLNGGLWYDVKVAG
jgi:predicted lipoprotein with Yx(FWY)xxD motif